MCVTSSCSRISSPSSNAKSSSATLGVGLGVGLGVRIRVRVRARARVRAAELRHLPRELLVAPPPLAQPDELAAQLGAPHLELGGELLHEALRDDAHHVQRARRLVRVRVRVKVRVRVRVRVSVMLGFRDRVRVRARVRMRV